MLVIHELFANESNVKLTRGHYPKQEKRHCVRDGYRDRYTMKIVMLSGRHEVKTQQEIL